MKKIFGSIRNKGIIASLLPLTAILAFVIIYYPATQKKMTRQRVEEQIKTQSQMLAFSVGAGLHDSNFDLVQTAFDWIKKDSSVVYTAIIDETNSVLFEYNPHSLKPDIGKLEGLKYDEATEMYSTAEKIEYKGQSFGKIAMNYSVEAINTDIRNDLIATIAVGLAIFLIGGIIIVFIFNKVSSNLNGLKNAASAASSGNLDIIIEKKSQDEVGDLTDMFNKMIDRIKDEISIAKSFQVGVNGAFFMADQSSTILAINEASCKIMSFNKTPEEIMGRLSVKDVFRKDDVTSKAFKGEFLSGHKDLLQDFNGAQIPVLIQSGPIYDSKKNMVAVFVFINDLRELEAKQREYLKEQVAPIAESLTLVAKGELKAKVELQKNSDLYELGQTVNRMIEDLNATMLGVNEAVEATASAANEISSSTEELAAGTQEQSNQTHEVAGAVEQMSKNIIETSNGAITAAGKAKEASIKAQKGSIVVDDTVKGMNLIAEIVNNSAHTIQELGKSSDQIGEIVQVIDDIADQTNLLALNAAIEAARAGEQGRGFAVVADEVRKLAERTTKATKEIAEKIKRIQNDTKSAVISIKKGTDEVENGKELTHKLGEVFKEIADEIELITSISNQTVSANEEMSNGAEQISRSMDGISSVTQQSAAGTQEIARAAEDLTRLTLKLQGLLGKFHIDDSVIVKNSMINGSKLRVV